MISRIKLKRTFCFQKELELMDRTILQLKKIVCIVKLVTTSLYFNKYIRFWLSLDNVYNNSAQTTIIFLKLYSEIFICDINKSQFLVQLIQRSRYSVILLSFRRAISPGIFDKLKLKIILLSC